MLLEIQNLSVIVKTPEEEKTLVNTISLNVDQNNIVALVGGSGSGKTTTGLSIIQLLAPELSIPSGKILFNGDNILDYAPAQMQQLRGKEISMVFQEPLYAFNPVFRIGTQIDEVLKYHTDLTAHDRSKRVEELLYTVGIADYKRIAQNYPHQLSGGLRQRAMIAQAIAASPKLIIADEPTSNLDVTLQARVIELFKQLRDELGVSILLITHDLGVVQHLTDEVHVMSQGHIVEAGKTKEVLTNPQQDYTKQLMEVLTV